MPAGNDKAFLGAGNNGWTLPIPIVKTAAGWRFDTKAAPEEMRIRRIGRNELAAIQVALAYTDAQKEYHAERLERRRRPASTRRARLSTPGKHDGLYWASLPGEPESPLGAEFADAKVGQPYHGYLYKILTAQGANAPGGARSYVKNGRMTEGYALVAWPAKYDDTGVMTFIVNQDGIVYQKNLGPNTDAGARAIEDVRPRRELAEDPIGEVVATRPRRSTMNTTMHRYGPMIRYRFERRDRSLVWGAVRASRGRRSPPPGRRPHLFSE